MTSDVDVLIAGGGPAGLGTAIAARRAGMSALVVEPKTGIIDKACGEGIMPGGIALLRELGVPLEGHPIRGIRWVDAADDSRSATGSFPRGEGLGVRRTKLHAALRHRALAAGVWFERGRVTSFREQGEGIVANGIAARWLVGADGLRSDVRRALGVELPSRRPPRYGARRHFAIAPWTDRVEIHFSRGAEAYVTPVGPRAVGVAFLFEPPGTWDTLLSRFPLLARRLDGAEPASRLSGGGPFERRLARRAKGHVILVGDAAGYLDPLTGEGVALGMATAVCAVAAMARGTAEAYDAEYAALTRSYHAITAALLAVVRRPALHAPLLWTARRVPALFDFALGALAESRAPAVLAATDTRGSANASPENPRARLSRVLRFRSPAYPP